MDPTAKCVFFKIEVQNGVNDKSLFNQNFKTRKKEHCFTTRGTFTTCFDTSFVNFELHDFLKNVSVYLNFDLAENLSQNL